MITDIMKNIFDKEFPGLSYQLSQPEVKGRGHFATNIAFLVAKEKKTSPMQAADLVRQALLSSSQDDIFENVEIAQPGFINITLTKEAIQNEFKKIARTKEWGSPSGSERKVRRKQNVIVEYSSPNIAKPMHVGHFRSTIIGDALANIHEFLGYKTIRWNYIGDWGVQFGKLVAAYKMVRLMKPYNSTGVLPYGANLSSEDRIPMAGYSVGQFFKSTIIKRGNFKYIDAVSIDKVLNEHPIETLLELYVAFTSFALIHSPADHYGREEFRQLEDGDKRNRELWERFKKESLKELNRTYKLLGVGFDITRGEAAYEKDLKGIIDYLLRKKIAIESEGAIIIPLDDLGLPPAMIQKSDGATLYLTRDIANLIYRVKKYKPTKIIYEIGSEQELHFKQLFAIAKADFLPELHAAKTTELVHVGHGLVLGEDGKKLSTRAGKTIFMEDVLEEAIEKTRKIIDNKNPDLPEKQKDKIAKIVAIGALKYNDLSQNRLSNITFDWDKMLSFEGDSGPYLQYTYARLKSIIRKAGGIKYQVSSIKYLNSELEFDIILKLDRFSEVIERVAESYFPNELAHYLHDLAKEINNYYHAESVLKAEPKIRAARLALIGKSAKVLKTGLNLLGIDTLEKM